jgi:hypothetical protein
MDILPHWLPALGIASILSLYGFVLRARVRKARKSPQRKSSLSVRAIIFNSNVGVVQTQPGSAAVRWVTGGLTEVSRTFVPVGEKHPTPIIDTAASRPSRGGASQVN